MNNKRFVPIIIVALLLLSCFPQHAFSQRGRKPLSFELLKNPIPNGIYKRGIYSPLGFSINTPQLGLSSIASVKTAQLNALHERSNIAPATKRVFHPNLEVLTGGLRRMDLDRQLPFSLRPHQHDFFLNPPYSTSVTAEIPSHIGHTTDNSTPSHIVTLPQRDVEEDIQSPLSVENDVSSEDSDIELLTNKWWIDYIGKIIEEQQIKQGIEQMNQQLFEKGMQFDFKSIDDVGFITYTYGYKLDAA